METTFGRGTTPVRGQQRSPCWLTTYPSPGMILHSLNGYYLLKICRDPNGKDRLNRPSSGGWSNHLGWSNQVPCHGISSIHPSRWILNFGKPTQPTLNQIGTSESWDDPSKSLTFLFWGPGGLDSATGRFGGRRAEMAAHARLGAGNWEVFWNAKAWTGEEPGYYTPGSTNIAG